MSTHSLALSLTTSCKKRFLSVIQWFKLSIDFDDNIERKAYKRATILWSTLFCCFHFVLAPFLLLSELEKKHVWYPPSIRFALLCYIFSSMCKNIILMIGKEALVAVANATVKTAKQFRISLSYDSHKKINLQNCIVHDNSFSPTNCCWCFCSCSVATCFNRLRQLDSMLSLLLLLRLPLMSTYRCQTLFAE